MAPRVTSKACVRPRVLKITPAVIIGKTTSPPPRIARLTFIFLAFIFLPFFICTLAFFTWALCFLFK